MRIDLRLLVLLVLLINIRVLAQSQYAVDPTFQSPFAFDAITDMKELPDGRLLITGTFTPPGIFDYRATARLETNGELDGSFNWIYGDGGGLNIWSDEHFYLKLNTSLHRCFLSNGDIDDSFQFVDLFNTSSGAGFHVFSDERIWRAGSFSKRLYDTEGNYIGSEPGYSLIQLLPNGLVDPSFVHKHTAPGSIGSIGETPDERLLLSGGQSHYDGHPVNRIIRVWPDGTLDTTFNSTVHWGVASSNYYFYPDGRILAFGIFQLPEYPDDTLSIIRLHPDGSTDASWPVIPFRNWGFFPGLTSVNDYHEFEPGKLMIVGQFVAIGEETAGAIAVIDTSGQVLGDHFGGTGAGFLQSPVGTSLFLQGLETSSDGSIYVFGSFQGFNDGYMDHPEQQLITRLIPVHVGVEERVPSVAFSIHPNPSGDHVSFSYSLQDVLKDGTLSVQDMLGREVFSQLLRNKEGLVIWDIHSISQGSYIVSLSDGSGRMKSEKLMIQR